MRGLRQRGEKCGSAQKIALLLENVPRFALRARAREAMIGFKQGGVNRKAQ
jgi:hypothetical protein